MSGLVRASSELHGPYLNGNGRERFTVQEVLQGIPYRGSEGKTFEPTSVLEGLRKIASAIQTPEDVEAAGDKWNWGIECEVNVAKREAIAESGMSEGIIARLALSEVDPASIKPEMTPEDLELVQIVSAAREVARRFHRVSR